MNNLALGSVIFLLFLIHFLAGVTGCCLNH